MVGEFRNHDNQDHGIMKNTMENDNYQSFTDLLGWRLEVEDGRQTWKYLETHQERKLKPQTFGDQYWLGILKDDTVYPNPRTAMEAAENGFKFYKNLQTDDGHWPGEYGGPMFLIPGLAIVMYITNTPFEKGQKEELIRYLKNRAHPEDGGWGIHIEGESTVFGTALNYVALRLLGVSKTDQVCTKARETLHQLGGATGIPAWGKFWLSVLNVYRWEGVNPIPPELWLLPYSAPIHPARMWIHTRQVYLPMSYLYGIKFQAKETDLIIELRKELYVEDYDSIDWKRQGNNVASVDLYAPHTRVLDFANAIMKIYENVHFVSLREKALNECLNHIRAEDRNTKYADLGPVNKVMNMLVVWIVDGPSSESFKNHVHRNNDFLWMANDGLRMNGTNGSQLWDTAFICQALEESGLSEIPEYQKYLESALDFLDSCQIKSNTKDQEVYFRHICKGAWPFSTRDQGYTVSDCTAEGLKTALLLQMRRGLKKRISDDRLFDAVNVLLSMQNANGGFASYECIRGPSFLEWLNPAEVFGNIMIEYSYPECTTAAVLGLTTFKKYFPDHRTDEIEKTIRKAVDYIKNAQRPDGFWFGSWGICFTYATYFALECLRSVGETYDNSEYVKKACDALVAKQRYDGGWGESYKACETGIWCEHENTQVVNTSWAVLGLMTAKYPVEAVIKKGIKLIMSRQKPNGEWLQEAIEGVFNKNCMISYPNYKFAFTIWALGRYAKLYGNPRLF